MGRSRFSAAKKALSPEAKEKKQEKPRKSKKWFGKHKKLDPISSHQDTLPSSATPPYDNAPQFVPSPKLLPELAPMAMEDPKLTEVNDEQTRHAYSVALATAVAADAAVAAAQAAAEVVRLTASSHFPGKSKEEIAAIKIQTSFRGYMARRALRALRGLVRLKTLIQGQSVGRQAASTLQCMQTLARVQYQIRERRLWVSEDKKARIYQLQQKHEKDFEKTGDNWDESTLSKGANRSQHVEQACSHCEKGTSSGLCILSSANVEECFKIWASNIHGPEKPALGMELVRTVDGSTSL